MEIKNNIGLYRKQSIFVFLLLIIAGLAGNRFPFSILNAHFVFGSFFAMLALQFFGLGWGIVAGFIISSSHRSTSFDMYLTYCIKIEISR